jgi:hypothetical protein
VEHLQYFTHYSSMFLYVSSSGNEDIIHVHKDLPRVFVHDLTEDTVHAALEGSRRVLKAEKHHLWLVQAEGHFECCFPMVFWLNLDAVIPPANVQGSEECVAMKGFKNLLNPKD